MSQLPYRRARPVFLATALALAVAAGSAARVYAQDVQATVAPFVGYTTWSKYINLKREPIFGLHAGALVRGRAGLEGSLGFVSSHTLAGSSAFVIDGATGPSIDMKQLQYGADVLYNFLPTAFTPYATLGWRHVRFTSSDEGAVPSGYNGYDAAVGARWDLTPQVGLRGEMRDVAFRFKSPPAPAPPAEQLTHSVYYSGALQFTVGPKPAPPPPPPMPVAVVIPPRTDTVQVPVAVPVPTPPVHDTTVVVSERERELLDTGSITTREIHFATARWDILPQSYPVLNDIGNTLSRWPQLSVEVGGHCDARGGDAYNMDLSQRRAESVLNYLTEHFPQISRAQYTARGYGKRVPVADNSTVEGMAMNRRVVFKVLNPEVLVKERERLHMTPGGTGH